MQETKMSKQQQIVQKENVIQAVLIADDFSEAFTPISDDLPLALFPVVNRPLLSYTLDFLSLGGVEETFIFSCTHSDQIKKYINVCIKQSDNWTLTMKVNIIVSESCRSFGDCLRDLDAKGLIRGDFVLLEPGVVSNIKLLPLLQKHNTHTKLDKGAVMTLVYQQTGVGQNAHKYSDEVVIASNANNRILFHKKLGHSSDRKINFPLDIFIENPSVSIRHDLKDTHIAICSSSVLPLFSDNFDFQTRDDFVRGLLLNEEIMCSTLYWELISGNQYGSAVTNWRMFEAVSFELIHKWIYPIIPPSCSLKSLLKDVVFGKNSSYDVGTTVVKSVIGDNVIIGKNVEILNSFIFSGCKIGDNCVISHAVIGPDCVLKSSKLVVAGSVLGQGVHVETAELIEEALVQATKPDFCDSKDKIGEKAYRIQLEDEDDDTNFLAKRFSRLRLGPKQEEKEESESEFSDSDEDDLSYTQSPVPDDTKLFFTEVIDSLTRGFEDELQCDNLILEINSSRYAYNVTVKEVNFNVVKAILHMSLRQPIGPQYYSYFQRLLSYFSPILKNYIRNESAMIDCLQAVEDVATVNEELNDKWVMFVLNWLYDKDHVAEDVFVDWFSKVDERSSFHRKAKPFADWLQDAEEESEESE